MRSSLLLFEEVPASNQFVPSPENQSFATDPVMMIYHINFGWPMLDEGAKVYTSAKKVTPRDAEAEAAAETASSAAVRAELSAEEGRDLVAKLAGWALGADDGFGALPDGELTRAVKTLKQVLERAEEIKSAREGAR